MQVTITGRNMTIPGTTEEYVRRKVERLERHLTEPVEARIELGTERTQNSNQREIVQVTLFNNGTIIRAEERAADVRSAVDAVIDKLDKQVRRYKDKQVRKRRVPGGAIEALVVQEQDEVEPSIVRTKRFKTLPMNATEAAEQMELLGHTFFLFLNEETRELNVLYKRADGNYGLLEPELE